jgi:SAM-dependent methyltransferase
VIESNPTAASWDAEYRAGRYADDAPLPFVGRIIETLRATPSAWTGAGLYVGCGNGRNYLPLLDAGLDVFGLDVSQEAITQLIERRPSAASRVACTDFRSFQPSLPGFAYLIAIQVFQHGDDAKVATLLKPGGLFFFRVNSASTQIYHAHTVLDRNAAGGFTIRYDDGPKHGLLIHFFSHAELLERLTPAFECMTAPREDVMKRSAPKTGTWAQWETTWRRRA